jgi:hypothetical protein
MASDDPERPNRVFEKVQIVGVYVTVRGARFMEDDAGTPLIHICRFTERHGAIESQRRFMCVQGEKYRCSRK